ncbi:MAG: RIP metalloprotease RseP [Prevotellaceae bacterium]|jgi:regulator of sigma E protease|nr:RIP metalloprotease RseP [Prevotellaceae bacterium]
MFIQASQFLLSLSILIIAHELGHFFFARLFGIRCEKFFLFFNPYFSILRLKKTLSGWKIKVFSSNEKAMEGDACEYGIGWLPLGGYVKISGMIDESLDTEQMKKPAEAWEFRSKPAWKRLLVMIGGVGVNFVLALAIYSAIFYAWGETYIPLEKARYGMEFSQTAKNIGFEDGDILLRADSEPLVKLDEESFRQIIDAKEVVVLRDGEEVSINMPQDFVQQLLRDKQGFTTYRFPMVIRQSIEGSPAEQAGLLAGDSIVSINGSSVVSFTECAEQFSDNKNKEITLGFYRNGALKNTAITPDSLGKVGVFIQSPMEILGTQTTHFSLLKSIPMGISTGLKKLMGYVGDMKYLFTKEGSESIGGFISIGSFFPAIWHWQAFWEMTAFLSIILAFMNILPIPALDGGHIMFLLYEVITRKKPSTEFMIRAQTIGMMLLFALLIYANGNDLIRIFN